MAKKASTTKKAPARKASGAKGSPRKSASAARSKAASGKDAAPAEASSKKKAAKKAARGAAPRATKRTAKKASERTAPAKRAATAKAPAAGRAKKSGSPAPKKAKASKKAASNPKKTASKAPASRKAKPKAGGPKKATSRKAAGAAGAAKPETAAGKTAPGRAEAAKAKAEAVKSKAEAARAEAEAAKSNRKGITIVTKKRIIRREQPPKGRPSVPAPTGSIMGMGLGSGRPLIPSSNAPIESGEAEGADGKKVKSPFTKRQLEKYYEVLIRKRRELLGDIDSMENEALKSEGGASSSLPQHMADQGSDTYDQTLSLDLAAADRTLLKEIDAALDRIADKTYGICAQTGRPISRERLDELPWARFSIEAARAMERHGR